MSGDSGKFQFLEMSELIDSLTNLLTHHMAMPGSDLEFIVHCYQLVAEFHF